VWPNDAVAKKVLQETKWSKLLQQLAAAAPYTPTSLDKQGIIISISYICLTHYMCDKRRVGGPVVKAGGVDIGCFIHILLAR